MKIRMLRTPGVKLGEELKFVEGGEYSVAADLGELFVKAGVAVALESAPAPKKAEPKTESKGDDKK